jgi:hypothetical protein
MRTTRVKMVHLLAATLTLTQICLAQQIEQPTATGQDDATLLAPGPVRTSAGDNDSWRMVNQNGTWWYFHPNGNWSSWDGTRWNLYQPVKPIPRPSGDVEVSGAELGLGVGDGPNSGLTNNPGAVINGKGGIGNTMGGAGSRRMHTRFRLPPSGIPTSPNPSPGGSSHPGGIPSQSFIHHGLGGGVIHTAPGAIGNGGGGAGQAPSGAGGVGSGGGIFGPRGVEGPRH